MSRYMDVDVFLDDFSAKYGTGNSPPTKQIIAMIENAPTIDAAPVVRSKWVNCCSGVICNLCGGNAGEKLNIGTSGPYMDYMKSAYCPNCGACMKEV